jgi:2-haloacid dehalogenase
MIDMRLQRGACRMLSVSLTGGATGTIDFGRVEAITFDCYGTLVDWETGILTALRPVLERHGASAADDELLETYAKHEATVEGGDYVSYREVLALALRGVCHAHRVEPSADDTREFSESVGDWPPFPDSAPALARLAKRFHLGVITNCDDDLFALSNRRLGVTFDWVVTAQQVRSYKPNPRGFAVALERMGVPRERVLHVAQSLFHDHAPAKQLGLSTVWINRRGDRPGFGATPPSSATPDLTAPDMATFARLALGEAEPSP